MHLQGLIFVQGIFMLLNEGGQFVLLSTMSLPCRGLAKKVLDLEHVSRSTTAETSHPSGQTVEETSLQLFRIGLSFCFLCENRCNMFSFSPVFFLHFLFSYFCFFSPVWLNRRRQRHLACLNIPIMMPSGLSLVFWSRKFQFDHSIARVCQGWSV